MGPELKPLDLKMGGLTCLKRILELNQGQKIVVASGYSSWEHNPRVLEVGARGFIAKPYRFADMIKVVRKVLEKN